MTFLFDVILHWNDFIIPQIRRPYLPSWITRFWHDAKKQTDKQTYKQTNKRKTITRRKITIVDYNYMLSKRRMLRLPLEIIFSCQWHLWAHHAFSMQFNLLSSDRKKMLYSKLGEKSFPVLGTSLWCCTRIQVRFIKKSPRNTLMARKQSVTQQIRDDSRVTKQLPQKISALLLKMESKFDRPFARPVHILQNPSFWAVSLRSGTSRT